MNQFEWEPGGLNLLRIINYQIDKIGGRIQTIKALQREERTPIIKTPYYAPKWKPHETAYLLKNPTKSAVEIAIELNISTKRVYEKRYKIKKAKTLVL